MAYTTINKSTDHFNTKLYTGTHSSSGAQSITGVGFQPDWCWLKNRSSNGYDNRTYDSVRTATKLLNTNLTNVEGTDAQGLTAFGTDGFTVGTSNGDNNNGDNYVSWNWKANGAGSANTDGSINSTVSANTTAGFSIVSYTGTGSNASVGHGLGVAPSMIIVKSRSSTDWWICYHKTQGATKYIALNFSNAVATNSGIWNDTEPTSSVFSIGTNGGTNGNGNNYIAYCFAEKTGYSRFGSYVGNGNADGAFIHTGFKPKFVFLKNTTNGNRGVIYDNKRLGYNPNNYSLGADVNLAEESSSWTLIDTYSNGFKCRSTDGSQNASNNTYIYMAFGQSLVGTNNIPATAR